MSAKLDYIGIVARDLEASRSFYALLDLRFEGESVHLEANGEGFRVGLDDESMMRESHPDWKEPVGQRVGIAFRYETSAEVDAAYAKVIAAGYHGHMPPFDAVWGQRYATVDDPDGNHVDLYAFL